MVWWTDGGEHVKKWIICLAGWFVWLGMPWAVQQAREPADLLYTAWACQVEVHAFYIEAASTLPEGQAKAVLRLSAQAVEGWPAGEAHSIALQEKGLQRVTLAGTCPPDAAQAQSMIRHMRMLLGEQASISVCLTGRTQEGDLSQVAERALQQLEDMPKEALREPRLVSMTGQWAQVALRADAKGAMVFLAQPLIPMEY